MRHVRMFVLNFVGLCCLLAPFAWVVWLFKDPTKCIGVTAAVVGIVAIAWPLFAVGFLVIVFLWMMGMNVFNAINGEK
jgi:hypothetical protein